LSIQEKPIPVSIGLINETFNDGDTVSPKTLLSSGLVSIHKGKNPYVKILASGVVSKKLNFTDCKLSGKAKEAVLKAGGTVK